MSLRLRGLWRFAAALLAMIFAVGIRWVLIPSVGTNTAYLTVFPAIAVLAVLLGTWPAVFSALVGIVAAEAWMFEPFGEVVLAWPFLVRSSAALISAAAVGVLASRLRKAMRVAEAQAEAAHASEVELRRATDLLKTILETTPDPIFATDKEGRFLLANPATRKALGDPDEEIIGKHTGDILQDPTQAQESDVSDKLVMETQRPLVVEQSITGKNGTQIFLATKSPLRNDKGEIVGVIGISRNISDRKRAEEAQRESEEKFRVFMEYSPAAAWIVDRHGRFRYLSPTYYRMFAVENSDLTGRPLTDVLPEELARVYLENSARVFQSGQVLEAVEPGLRFATADKGEFLVYRFPIKDKTGEVLLGAIAMDVTNLKRAERDIREAKEAAEAANLAKSQFLATMSHELRTPLTAILGFAELLSQNDLKDSERGDFIGRIRRNADLLTSLIDEILDLSKIESGKLEPEFVDVSLQDVMTDVTGVLAHQAKKKGLSLDIQIDDSVPATVMTDPTRLRQILTNIIGNAIKFTERGSVSVSLFVERSAGRICFLVKDTGEGIDRVSAGKIFEPFVQADASHTRRYGGTGLGLVLSRRLARVLGGDVNLVESAPGRGSTFKVTIALVEKPRVHGPLRDEATAMAERHREKKLTGIRILVADDSPDNLLLVTRMLTKAGVIVDVATNGEEALHNAQKSRYDLVLMDIQMPKMDGYEATKRLRAQGYQVPIVALTAYAMRSDRVKSIRSGFNDYISKPITKQDLLAIVVKNIPAISAGTRPLE